MRFLLLFLVFVSCYSSVFSENKIYKSSGSKAIVYDDVEWDCEVFKPIPCSLLNDYGGGSKDFVISGSSKLEPVSFIFFSYKKTAENRPDTYQGALDFFLHYASVYNSVIFDFKGSFSELNDCFLEYECGFIGKFGSGHFHITTAIDYNHREYAHLMFTTMYYSEGKESSESYRKEIYKKNWSLVKTIY